MAWTVVAATATGLAHREAGLPCQDAYAWHAEGDALIAAVCDGAGSSAHADIGAEKVARTVVAALSARVLCSGVPLDLAVFRDWADEAVAAARDVLARAASDGHGVMRDYACTLVAVVAGPLGGWFLHIGDGTGVCELRSVAEPVVSLPENGEYANETWFVTSDDWAAHVRVTGFTGPPGLVVLMSDGAQPFVMAKGGATLYRAFVDPVVRYLRNVDSTHGAQALQRTLSDPRTEAITADDKTLLLAMPAQRDG